MKRRLGERPRKRNHPYPGAPNTVDPVIDDLTRDKTDQEISMILNAPTIAIFIPVGSADISITTKAQKAFNTHLRHTCGYRPKKEEAVDTKNARGFAITKQITEEHSERGTIPSFETVDPKDLIVPPETKDIQKAERLAGVLRLSRRVVKEKPWNMTAVKELLEKLTSTDSAGEKSVTESSNDEESTFKVTKELIGLNTSDTARSEIVVWEICHYATEWDVEQANGLIEKGDKCISWVCPDAPELLLHIVRWKEEDSVEPLEGDAELAREIELAVIEQREPVLTIDIVGKDKPWPYVQHRYEYRSRLWYDTRGIGHICMDNQIIATSVQNARLVQYDYSSSPMFEGGSGANQQNVVVKPGAMLPEGVKPVKMASVGQDLSFEGDYQRRVASTRSGSGGGTYSGEVSSSRKLEKTATEVQSDNAKGSLVSSASVDRFNDPDRELFQQLWAEMKRMKTALPIISNGKFEGILDALAYEHDFIIIPAASQKTLNPDMQFMKAQEIMRLNAEFAATTGADVGAGLKHITEMADPDLANTLYPDAEGGELPITPTLNEHEQAIEQLAAGLEQANEKAEAALNLGKDVADAIA